jgi:hypothetical protein
MLLLPIAPGAVWSGFVTLAGDVVRVTSRFDRSLGRHRRLLVLVRALAGLGGSAPVIVPAVASGTPAGLALWPSLVAPTAAPSPVLGAGCRPGVVAGMGAVSSTVAKMRRAVSRMGSGSVPVVAAAMPVVDRPHTATATSSPTRRRRPGLPLPQEMARRARAMARSSANTASWPASSAGLGAATAAANSAATSAYPRGRLVQGKVTVQ